MKVILTVVASVLLSSTAFAQSLNDEYQRSVEKAEQAREAERVASTYSWGVKYCRGLIRKKYHSPVAQEEVVADQHQFYFSMTAVTASNLICKCVFSQGFNSDYDLQSCVPR